MNRLHPADVAYVAFDLCFKTHQPFTHAQGIDRDGLGVRVHHYRLSLAAEARMNIPGRAEDNWSWRCTEEMMSAANFDSLRELTKSSNRLGTLRRYGKLEETL